MEKSPNSLFFSLKSRGSWAETSSPKSTRTTNGFQIRAELNAANRGRPEGNARSQNVGENRADGEGGQEEKRERQSRGAQAFAQEPRRRHFVVNVFAPNDDERHRAGEQPENEPEDD